MLLNLGLGMRQLLIVNVILFIYDNMRHMIMKWNFFRTGKVISVNLANAFIGRS